METKLVQTSKARKLRESLAEQTVAIPGAFNALTAIQIEQAGYEAVYISGAALSAARGLPDLGLLSLTEVVADALNIAGAVGIPAIVDADTGYGPPLTVMRAVREFERAGLAGMQIEDQELPKKCGHLAGKHLVSISEMVIKIRAAVDAKHDPDFLVVARTDARAVEGMEGAIRRATAYVTAGADAVFPEALQSLEEFQRFAQAMTEAGIDVPLIANMTEFGQTPYLAMGDFESIGYRAVLFPVTALRAAACAVATILGELKTHGTQRDSLSRLSTRQQISDLLHYQKYEDQERRLNDESSDPNGSH